MSGLCTLHNELDIVAQLEKEARGDLINAGILSDGCNTGYMAILAIWQSDKLRKT